MHVIANTVLPGDLIFDIGANRGDKAAWFVESGAKVVCVEPQPAMVQLLNDRFGSNPQVVIVPKGLASRPGTLEMSINTAAPELSTFSDEWKVGRFSNAVWDQGISVEVTTFDQLVAEFGLPRFSKVDVEGFEKEVFLGLSANIGCLSFEFTTEYLINASDILEYLSRIGYSKFNFSIGEEDNFFLKRWLYREELLSNLVEICSGNGLCWGDIYAI